MLNHLQILAKSRDNIADILNINEQLDVSTHIADLPNFLSTPEGSASVKLLVDEFLCYAHKKHGLPVKN
jgi:hypothetical protein